ncbi:MAG: rRNA maturation RNase YbeY [Azoarcus sp.]|jgi:probable rRNA maturation factor|nr:rRNA maturation RNase YbeY [Azoarcus sp.]
MAKQAGNGDGSPRIVAIDGDGRRSRVRAERLEIEFDDGRRLILGFPDRAWGDLEIEADVAGDESAVPLINVQPGACNVLNLRVEVNHELQPIEAFDLPVREAPPVLDLEVQKALDGADRLNAPKKHQIRRWAQAALLGDVEVTVRLVGEAEGRELNKNYRSKDYATNVLTFVYDSDRDDDDGGGEGDAGGKNAPLRGDLVLCVPVVAREAVEQGKALDAHFAHLVVHGMLHLQGFDHRIESDATVMETREREILAALGYADPYR